MTEVTVKSLKRSSTFAAGAEIWRICSRFVLTPIVIGKLGLEGYGAWVLLFSICAYVSMFNVSAGLAYSKYTAEYDKIKDYKHLSEIIAAGVVLIGGVAFILLVTIWIFRLEILRFVNVPEELIADASSALLLVLLAVLLRMTIGCVFQILAGLQRMDLQFKFNILASMLEFCVAIVLLFNDYGLLALALGHLFGQMIATLIAWSFCKRLCPALKVFPLRFSRTAFQKMVSLAGKFQLLSFVSTAYRNGLNMLISALCGISMLAVFDLANKLLKLGMTFSGAIGAPLMPAFASLHSSSDEHKWWRLYTISSKTIAFMAIICFSGLVVFADLLILVWTGEQFPQAAWTLRVMAIANFLVIVTRVNTASLRSKGRIRTEMTFNLICAGLTAILIFPANLYWSYKGVVGAVTISLVIGSIWFLAVYANREGKGFGHYLRGVLIGPSAVGVLICVFGLYARPFVDGLAPDWPERWAALLEAGLFGMALAFISAFILWHVSFSADERQYLLRRLLSRK